MGKGDSRASLLFGQVGITSASLAWYGKESGRESLEVSELEVTVDVIEKVD